MPESRTEEFYIPEDGEIPNGFPKWAADMCQLFAGEKTEITFERPTRSLDQNSYLWGVVYPAVHDGFHDTGMTQMNFVGPSDEVVSIPPPVRTIHEWFKRKYLQPGSNGQVSTQDLDMTEMHYFIESIRWDETVQDLGINVPQPNMPPPEAYE